jgi:hypothetical protein
LSKRKHPRRQESRRRRRNVEWPYREEEAGPPIHHRLKPERIEDLALKAGFKSVERAALAHMEMYRLTP